MSNAYIEATGALTACDERLIPENKKDPAHPQSSKLHDAASIDFVIIVLVCTDELL
jgi:hypothetical protein